MTAPQKRLLTASLLSLLGVVIGALGGYLLARLAVIRQAQIRMEHFAVASTASLDDSVRESRSVLHQMNQSAYAYCSPEELDYFRSLIYQSHTLKDAGHLRNGRIDCSTTLGRAPSRQPLLRPDFVQADGARVYRNLPLLTIAGDVAVAAQVGDSYVVYNPFVPTLLKSPHTHYTLADTDVTTHSSGFLVGKEPQINSSTLTHDTQARQGTTIFATRCSSVSTVCVAAYTTVPEVLASSKPMLILLTAMGGLAGCLLGLIGSLVYRRNKSMHHQLLRAIRHGALRVVYQPIVEIETGRILEAEALVRWTNDDNQSISPDVFIRVAEDGGFVGEITRLVVHQVLRDFAQTFNHRPGFRVNVNIAAADLADDAFLPMLGGALADANVRPESLGIEITESYTARQQVAKETILKLRARGHHVAIDDFGTGYSSLAYLHDLSVDAIKVDKAFTRAIGTDAVTVSILPQILSMADQLGLRVIIEGIEAQQQADYFMESRQTVRAQGWLFGHPIPAGAFLLLLVDNDDRFQQQAAQAAHGLLPVSA
jgi:sensor c-di-GMP phosphodiesterase-like protein